jgi:hypothetical protein
VIGVGAAAQGLGPVTVGTVFSGLVAVLALVAPVALVSILRADRRRV